MVMGWDDAIMMGLPLLSGLFGGDDEAEKQYQAAIDELKKVGVPDVEAQKLALQKLVSVGTISPEQEQAITQEASKMNEVQVDPRLKEAQMKALAQMSERGQGGLSAADKLALDDQRRAIEGDQQAQQASVIQNMQQRGVGGSGMELAARLGASQGAANRSAESGRSQMAQAQMAGLQALQDAGTMGGQMRGQEFGEKSAKAQAEDQINAFNTAQRSGVQMRNVAGRNQAQYANLANAQDIANQNVGLSNAEQKYNKELIQKKFDNDMARAKGLSDAHKAAGGGAEKEAAADNKAAGSVAAGLAGGYGEWVAGGGGFNPKKKFDPTTGKPVAKKYNPYTGKEED